MSSERSVGARIGSGEADTTDVTVETAESPSKTPTERDVLFIPSP
jgi:hypothetical protein